MKNDTIFDQHLPESFTTNSLLLPKEPLVPGVGSVNTALLEELSLIVAPFLSREV